MSIEGITYTYTREAPKDVVPDAKPEKKCTENIIEIILSATHTPSLNINESVFESLFRDNKDIAIIYEI